MTTDTALALTLPQPAEASLTAVLVLATAVWIGGLVAIFVVARVAHATLGAAERVAFFRRLGRVYGLVGGVALTVALANGPYWPPRTDGTAIWPPARRSRRAWWSRPWQGWRRHGG